jgi:hypothetical protein
MASSEIPASQRRYSNSELLMLVRQVALVASPDAPKTVSQRTFNAVRGRVVEEGCPEAAYLVKRLRGPWREVLALAFADEKNSLLSLANRGEANYADKATCVAALQLVARRLEINTLRPAQYEHAREELLRERRGRHRQELLERLPSAGVVDAKGWDELLAFAGLRPRTLDVRYTGIATSRAVERFLEAQGRLPSLRELRRFARERGLSLQDDKRIGPHTEELRIRRTKEGRWTPSRVPIPSKRPPWQEIERGSKEMLDRNNPRIRRKHWTLERIQAGLQIAVSELQPGETLTLTTLRRLAKANRDIPTASVVGRAAKNHGTTITALRAEALAAIRVPHPPRSEAAE